MVDRIKGATKEVAEGAGETSSVISRHPEGKTNAKYEHDESGFLWSWNFMISKRWKNISNTGATGDIQFMDKLLADFRRALVRPLLSGSGLQGMITLQYLLPRIHHDSGPQENTLHNNHHNARARENNQS